MKSKTNRIQSFSALFVWLLLCAGNSLGAAEPASPKIPAIRHLDPPQQEFFSKQLDFETIPIKAHQVVSDEALVAGYARLQSLFAHFGSYREAILGNLAKARVELHIIGRSQVTTDLPEWRKDKGKPLAEYNGLTRDQRTRGMGGRLVSCGEENLLGLKEDRYFGRSICVHEFAHAIRNHGITPALREQFNQQFQRSLAKGLWRGSYAGSNADEFFAELTMWYLGTHGDLGMTGAKPRNGTQGLRDYDPEAYALLDAFYGGRAEWHPAK